MGRRSDYNSGTKVPATNGTTVFTSADLPSSQVVAYHLAWDDTTDGTLLGDMNRLRLKANGTTIVDCSGLQLRAFNQRFGLGRPSYGDRNMSALSEVANIGNPTQRLTIPLYNMLEQYSGDQRDACQFPPGAQVTLEISWDTVGTAPVIQAGWTTTDQAPRAYPKLLSSQMNIGASQASGRYNFSEDGMVCAYGINTVGMSRVRMVVSGDQILHMGGILTPVSAIVALDTNSLFMECQAIDGKIGELANSTAVGFLLSSVIVNPLWVEAGTKKPAASGSSYVELTTTASWGGASNELSTYSITPIGNSGRQP